MTRVQIRASSAVVKAGLESLLREHPSLQIVENVFDGQADNEDSADDLPPDVLLAEVESRDDETALDAFNTAANGTPVVLLVSGSAAEWADALRQGVRAVLTSNASGAQIAAATEAAAAGLVVIHPSEVDTLLPTHGMNQPPVVLPEALTSRETEVLRLLAEGLGNKEIASRLGVSEHTVKFHVASIMGKMGAASRTEAVTLGIRHGIVLI